MSKQLISPVKGTRDFYPEEMAFRNWLYQKIREVSEKFGYQEFDGPLIEYLDLYSDKTSEEILKEQAFSLKDRDGRDILLRPELTPTFARMVAQKGRGLLLPIRWYSFGRAWRYEQPQKGRTREFFQWEINILGPESPEADAEIIALAVEYFKALGITSEEVVIRVSDRTLFDKFCQDNNIPENKKISLIRFMDRMEKFNEEEITQKWDEMVGLDIEIIDKVQAYIKDTQNYSDSEWLTKVINNLKQYEDVMEYVEVDRRIFRGFDYYTRTVFEAWPKKGSLNRALFGGGRFDNLTETLGGERIPGVGMAPGDVPIQVFLEDLGKMPNEQPKIAKALVTVFSSDLMDKSTEVSSKLRLADITTELWVDPESKLEKQLRYADQKNIPYVVIIGPEEAETNQVTLKDFKNNTQQKLNLEELIKALS